MTPTVLREPNNPTETDLYTFPQVRLYTVRPQQSISFDLLSVDTRTTARVIYSLFFTYKRVHPLKTKVYFTSNFQCTTLFAGLPHTYAACTSGIYVASAKLPTSSASKIILIGQRVHFQRWLFTAFGGSVNSSVEL